MNDGWFVTFCSTIMSLRGCLSVPNVTTLQPRYGLHCFTLVPGYTGVSMPSEGSSPTRQFTSLRCHTSSFRHK